jgi:hypothetical protein
VEVRRNDSAMRYGFKHPLDVDLADFASGLIDDEQRDELEQHLRECLLCRIKLRRLRNTLSEEVSPGGPKGIVSAAAEKVGDWPRLDFPTPRVATVDVDRLLPGQLWATGDEERILLLVVRLTEDRVFVAPVTFDALSADDETVVIDEAISPFDISLAVYPMLAVELPESVLAVFFAELVMPAEVDLLLAGSLSGTSRGEPINGPTDPRLEFRQILADSLAVLEEVSPDPDTAADAPSPQPERLAQDLATELRDRRGEVCKVHRLGSWEEHTLAYSKGWSPIARVDEFGTILVVFDTLSGLVNDADFNAALSVLTRFNASALVVLVTGLSPSAEVFDAASLNYGIGVPSGETSPPSPMVSGLAPVDAISKFLDQNSAWSETAWTTRGSASPSDVLATLSRSAASALEEVARQGRRARIASKIAGYESAEHLGHELNDVLRGALAGESVAERIANLADRNDS